MLYRVHKILVLALIVLSLSAQSLYAQSAVLWSQSYGGDQDETFQDIFITDQGGAQVIGYGQSDEGSITSGKGLYDMIICEMGSLGELNWTNNIGGTQNDIGKSILIHEDKTFIGGVTYSTDLDVKYNLGGGDIFFGSLDSDQQIDQSSLLGGNKLDNVVAIKMHQDGSIILVANTNSTDVNQTGVGGGTDIYVCRLLPSGTLLWETTLGAEGVDKAADMVINQQGEIIIVGSTNSTSFLEFKKGIKDGFAVCMNSDGKELWGKRFGNGNYASFKACDVDQNDNIIITGTEGQISESSVGINGKYNDAVWALKLSSEGVQQWRNKYGDTGNDYATDIVSSLDGGMLIVGNTESTDGLLSTIIGANDAFALKLNAEGQQEWTKGYGGSSDDLIHAVTQDRAGHYWLTGNTKSDDRDLSQNNGGDDAWILKLEGEKPELQLDLGSFRKICEGEALLVDATIAQCDCQYIWSDGIEGPIRNFVSYNSFAISLTVIDESGNSASDDISIIVNPSPNFNLNANPVSCANNEDGRVTVTLLSALPPLQYQWSDSSITTTLDDLAGGQYALTLTDRNSCSSIEEITLHEATPILVFSDIETPLCAEIPGEISLTVTGGTAPYKYNWNNDETTSDIQELAAGNYIVTITDAADCTQIASYTIDKPNALSVSTDVVDNNCTDTDIGSIALDITGGTPPYETNWMNGQTTSSLTALVSGVYSATIQDANGCELIIQEEINSPQSLALSNIEVSNVSCQNLNDGIIAITLEDSAAEYDYIWSNGDTSPIISDLAPGYYEVTVTTLSGCQSVYEAQIEKAEDFPSLNISLTDPTCYSEYNGTVDLSAANPNTDLSYLWADNFTGNQRENLNAGDYEVTVSNANGCTQIQAFTLSSPAELDMNFNISKISCAGEMDGAIKVNSTGGVAPYNLNSAPAGLSNNQWVENLSPGIYFVELTDANGCQLTLPINLEDPEPIVIDGIISDVSCFGQKDGSITTVVSGGEGSIQYFWGGNNNEEQIDGLPAGIFQVEVLDDNGCSQKQIFQVLQPDELTAEYVLSAPSTSDDDGIIELMIEGGNSPYIINWDNGASGSTIHNLSAGTYQYEIIDVNNCVLLGSILLETTTSIVPLQSLVGVSVYPNPVDRLLSIQVDVNYQDMQIQLQNNLGQLVYQSTFNHLVPGSYSIPVDQLPTGLYHLTLTNTVSQGSFKIMVSH